MLSKWHSIYAIILRMVISINKLYQKDLYNFETK